MSLISALSVGSVIQTIAFYLIFLLLLYFNFYLIRTRGFKKPGAPIILPGLTLYRRIGLRASEIRKRGHDYRRLFEDIPVPMFIFDSQNFHFLAVNKAATIQYGYSEEELLQLKITDIRPPEEVPAFLASVGQVPGNYADAGRWLHRKKTGAPFMSTSFPSYDLWGRYGETKHGDRHRSKGTHGNGVKRKNSRTGKCTGEHD